MQHSEVLDDGELDVDGDEVEEDDEATLVAQTAATLVGVSPDRLSGWTPSVA